MEKIKYLASALGGVAVVYIGKYYPLYIFVAAAVLFDFITGMCAAVISGQGLSSHVASIGLLKKVMLLVSVAFGTFLDSLMPFCAHVAGVELDGVLIFSAMICVYICVTECISILENIYRCTDSALPKWLMKLLTEAKNNLDNKEV